MQKPNACSVLIHFFFCLLPPSPCILFQNVLFPLTEHLPSLLGYCLVFVIRGQNRPWLSFLHRMRRHLTKTGAIPHCKESPPRCSQQSTSPNLASHMRATVNLTQGEPASLCTPQSKTHVLHHFARGSIPVQQHVDARGEGTPNHAWWII